MDSITIRAAFKNAFCAALRPLFTSTPLTA
jgi:hypothetical protein